MVTVSELRQAADLLVGLYRSRSAALDRFEDELVNSTIALSDFDRLRLVLTEPAEDEHRMTEAAGVVTRALAELEARRNDAIQQLTTLRELVERGRR